MLSDTPPLWKVIPSPRLFEESRGNSLLSDHNARRMSRRCAITRLLGFSALPLAAVMSCSIRGQSPGMQYSRNLLEILKKIRTDENTSLRNAANLFAHTIISRNICFVATANPSNPGYLSEDTPGLPRIFVYLRSKEMAETLRPGDTLLVTVPGELSGIAKVRGAKIAGITSPMVLDDYGAEDRGRFAVKRELDGLAEIIIHTRLPVWDGLVNLPEYPFGILPGSGPVELAVVTALAGETYRRSEKTLRLENVGPRDALEFLDEVMKRIRRLREQRETFDASAALIGKKILNRGTLWIYDRHKALARELGRGSGVPLFARPITKDGITNGTLRAIDALIFASLESNLPEDLHLIRMARGITNAITTICPRESGGGYRIYKEAPFGLDNFSPEKEGVRKFNNNARTFLHTGGIMNCTVLWMLLGEIIGKMISAGQVPCCLMGEHLTGSADYNAEAREKARQRGF